MGAWIAGELAQWPTKHRMAKILRAAGLRVTVGQYSIRIEDFPHFKFQEYGGDLGDPQIQADAESVEEMTVRGKLISDALARAGIKHRFEIYDDRGGKEMVGYLHHDWPPTAGTPSEAGQP